MAYKNYCATCDHANCGSCMPTSDGSKPPTNYAQLMIKAENGEPSTVENDTYCNSCANVGQACSGCVKIAGGPPRNYRAIKQRRGTTKPNNIVDMTPYEADVMRTAPQLPSNDFLLWAAMGLCEAGEVQNEVKKYIYQGATYSREKLIDELGDLFFYMTAIMSNAQITLNEVIAQNIEKRQDFVPGKGRPND